MKPFLFLLIIAPFFSIASDTTSTKELVSQTITYHTKKAGEVFMVWGINNWQNIPGKEVWPTNSYIKKDMIWTQMERQDTIFSVSITLPHKTYMNYMFWVPVDVRGDSTDGWDTYGEQTYSTIFDKNNLITVDDSALWMPEKEEQFDMLKSGWKFLLISSLFAAIFLFSFRSRLSFSKSSLLIALSFLCFIIACITRIQMNAAVGTRLSTFFGLTFFDGLYYTAFAMISISLVHVSRKVKLLNIAVLSIVVGVLLLSLLHSLLNIELIKQIGRPLNYQWLYYSNFLSGTDTKNALAYNLSAGMFRNLSLIIIAVIVCAASYSLIPKVASRKLNISF